MLLPDKFRVIEENLGASFECYVTSYSRAIDYNLFAKLASSIEYGTCFEAGPVEVYCLVAVY